jgi:hypothetical protein
MTKKIRLTDRPLRRIRDTGPCLPRLDPAEVAKALGAEPTGVRVEKPLGPLVLFAVRQELFRRLQSSGDQTELNGATHRPTIPLNDQEWAKLEELAAAISSPSFTPSAAQVASVLLTLSLQAVGSESRPSGSSLLRELAAKVAIPHSPDRKP